MKLYANANTDEITRATKADVRNVIENMNKFMASFYTLLWLDDDELQKLDAIFDVGGTYQKFGEITESLRENLSSVLD